MRIDLSVKVDIHGERDIKKFIKVAESVERQSMAALGKINSQTLERRVKRAAMKALSTRYDTRKKIPAEAVDGFYVLGNARAGTLEIKHRWCEQRSVITREFRGFSYQVDKEGILDVMDGGHRAFTIKPVNGKFLRIPGRGQYKKKVLRSVRIKAQEGTGMIDSIRDAVSDFIDEVKEEVKNKVKDI
jgi:hypothetical protein